MNLQSSAGAESEARGTTVNQSRPTSTKLLFGALALLTAVATVTSNSFDAASAKTTKRRTTARRTIRTTARPTTARTVTTVATPTSLAPPTTKVSATASANKFAAQLFDVLAQASPSENFVVSGYSAAEALSMLRVGAAGNSAAQLDAALAEGSGTIDHAQRRAQREQLTAPGGPDDQLLVKVANSVWVNKSYTLFPQFSSETKKQYAAQSESIDFSKPLEATATINGWVASATDNNIKELISPDVLNAEVAAVLANAVHFKGSWISQFNKRGTAPSSFDVNGKRVQTPTMFGSHTVKVSDSGTMLTLPYRGGYAMELLVPKMNGSSSLRSAASALHSETSQSGRTCRNVDVGVPKWSTKSRFVDVLKDTLIKMGIVDIFRPGVSNIPSITSTNLFVSVVIQEAKISVDEDGTVASAATAVVAMPSSAPPPPPSECPKSFLVDRPFVYVIKHVPTNTVLFAGQVIDPTK